MTKKPAKASARRAAAKKPRPSRTVAKFPERIETTVSASLKQRIENYADAESISVSAYVRRLLDNQVPGGI